MENYLIISAICLLLLTAYVLTISANKIRIPSVILLLGLGFMVKTFNDFLGIYVPDLSPILPILGFIGLILIVLEGTLELKLNKEHLPLVGKTIITAFLPLIVSAFIIGYGIFYCSVNTTFKTALINAIPFCIISSAIAISSVAHLKKNVREFSTYESSLSDIIGVLFFNFIVLNEVININSVSLFIGQITVMIGVSLITTVALAYLISHINHNVKFAPIVLLIILIFALSEIYHLPALIFIMLFGLLIENFDIFCHFKSFDQLVNKLKPDHFELEVAKFKELTIEAAFLVRSLFFLVFGYLMRWEYIINMNTIVYAIFITLVIYLLRGLQLRLLKIKLLPLLFIAPRGLITILLFLNISNKNRIEWVNQSLVIQVIILTALIMMFGLMFSNKDEKKKSIPNTLLS